MNLISVSDSKSFISTAQDMLYLFQSRNEKTKQSCFTSLTFKSPERKPDYESAIKDESECRDSEKENIDPGLNLFEQYKDNSENIVPVQARTSDVEVNSGSGSCSDMTLKSSAIEESSECEYDVTRNQGPLTPHGTPIKNLPFSPSQVTTAAFISSFDSDSEWKWPSGNAQSP